MNTKPDITYTPADRPATAQVKSMLRNKWPEAIPNDHDRSRLLFQSGLEPFDRLFPEGGIPYGQLVEISGGPSSGKTGLLLHILAGLTKTMHVAYVDTGGMFFPGAAAACGVDLTRLVVVGAPDSGGSPLAVGSTPSSLHHTMRTTELMLQHKMVGCVVCDLVGQRDVLAIAWCHRLRIRTVRARGLVIFITENNSHIIPPSMVSLRLEIERKDVATVAVTVAKSRISPEGARAEVILGGV